MGDFSLKIREFKSNLNWGINDERKAVLYMMVLGMLLLCVGFL